MTVYSVKECYYTLQGEGAQAGSPAVFLRFAGCNLWSGLERDRQNAICQFCDTDFVGTDGAGGGKFENAEKLAAHAISFWPAFDKKDALIVCTGGEPLLQLDASLIAALKAEGFRVAVETNGTIKAPAKIDWICVSPKAGADLVQTSGHELKLVYPQVNALPDQFSSLAFDYFFLQPMDGPQRAENTSSAIEYCKTNPKWRLSLQTHKLVGIP